MFSKLKLGHKMALGFATLIAIMVVVGGVASWTMKHCSTIARTLMEQDVNVMQIANDAGDATSGLKLNARSYGLSGDASYLDKVAGYEGNLKTALKRGTDLVALQPGMERIKEGIDQTNKAIEDFDLALKETRQAQESISDSAGAHFDAAEALTASLDSMATDRKKEVSGHNASVEDVQQAVTRFETVNEIAMTVRDIRSSTLKGRLDHNPRALSDADASIAGVEKRLDDLRLSIDNPTVAARIQGAQLQAQAFRKSTVRMSAGMIAMQDAYAHRAKAYAQLDAAVDAMSQSSRDHMTASASSIGQSLGFGMTLTVGGLLVALLVGVVVAFGVTRSVTRPLTRIIGSLTLGADQTLSAAEQVSSSSQTLAQGASEQAANLEETSSCLEEMSNMTRKTADTAREASLLSAQTKTSADQGNRTMARMADAIDGIQKASSETAKIVKTIDEIAFQTNLLALNAAVEAARAGEAGKGFAVVAEEVRNLAMRSAEAAKTTASLIEGSVASSRNGVTIAQEVGKTLVEIQQSVEKVNTLIGDIAAASQEQSQGIGQVSQAVQQLDKVTQSNAAGAEESAAASEELNSQAEQLNAVVAEMLALVGGHAIVPSSDSGYRGSALRQAARPHPRLAQTRLAPARTARGRRVDPSRLIPSDAPNHQDDFADFDAAA